MELATSGETRVARGEGESASPAPAIPDPARPSPIWGLLFVLLVGALAGRSLLADGFYSAHDNLLNVHRLYEMDKCVADGNLTCRWAPDMGFGYGQPLFNFYPPLATGVAELGRLAGLSYIDAIKTSFFLCLLVTAAGMYLFAREFFGTGGAIAASVLCTFTPYRAIDLFVRGALAEAWGLALLPLLFWTSYRAAQSRDSARLFALACAVTWAAMLLTHQLVLLMVAPIYALWCLLLWQMVRRSDVQESSFPHVEFALAHLVGVALAAYFLIPSLAERDTIHLSSTISRYDWNRYTNNFLSLRQLLFGTRPWGFGALGAADAMSLFAGLLHWGLALGASGVLVLQAARGAIDGPRREAAWVAGFFAIAGWLALLMTLPLSRWIWELLPALEYLQFPWRFLGIAAFAFPLATAWLARALDAQPRLELVFALCVSAAAILLNWEYFRVAKMHPVDDASLVAEGQIARTLHGAFDFLPRSVDTAPLATKAPARDGRPAYTLEGQAELSELARGSNWVHFVAQVAEPDASGASRSGALVRINTYRYPDWRVQIDGVEHDIAAHRDPLGRIHVQLPPGRHHVRAELHDTAARRWGNSISLFAAAFLLLWTAFAWRSRSRARP